jgi:hypothetical protein
MTSDHFNPEIVAFCCHYCAYAAADLAGAMRLEYPTSIKVIELPCTGKLDVLYVLPTACWWRVDWKATVITWKVISTPAGELNMRRSCWMRSVWKVAACR